MFGTTIADCERCGAVEGLAGRDDPVTHHCADGGRGRLARRVDPFELRFSSLVDVRVRA